MVRISSSSRPSNYGNNYRPNNVSNNLDSSQEQFLFIGFILIFCLAFTLAIMMEYWKRKNKEEGIKLPEL